MSHRLITILYAQFFFVINRTAIGNPTIMTSALSDREQAEFSAGRSTSAGGSTLFTDRSKYRATLETVVADPLQPEGK